MAPTFNNTGDFRDATVIQGETVNIGRIVGNDRGAAKQLEDALAEVTAALDELSEGHTQNRDAIAQLLKQASDEAAKETPNPNLLQGTLNGLRSAGNAVVDSAPRVARAVDAAARTIEQVKGLAS